MSHRASKRPSTFPERKENLVTQSRIHFLRGKQDLWRLEFYWVPVTSMSIIFSKGPFVGQHYS